jgi:hypothetical protein
VKPHCRLCSEMHLISTHDVHDRLRRRHLSKLSTSVDEFDSRIKRGLIAIMQSGYPNEILATEPFVYRGT